MKRVIVLLLLVALFLTGCGNADAFLNGEQKATSNIKKLEFSREDDLALTVGKKSSSGYLRADVTDRSAFSPEDVIFVSNNPAVATISFSRASLTTTLYYEVVAAGAGETEVYAKSKDGLVESKHIKVVVSSNIKKLEFSKDDPLTLEVGKKDSSGYLKADVTDRSAFSPEDVIFVSNNPAVATISFSRASLTTTLYYEVVAVGAGETEVYAKSKDGSVESEHIKVTVPRTTEVESVSIDPVGTITLGEKVTLKATTLPLEAKSNTIRWSSSDESVATVNAKGEVVAVGGGVATITASAPNGVEGTIVLRVDASKRSMRLYVTRSRADDFSIGNEWTYVDNVNGERAGRTMVIAVGDRLTLQSQYTESDTNPDVGQASMTHVVTKEDLQQGFEVEMDVYVKENGGKNAGKSAHFVVTYRFSIE